MGKPTPVTRTPLMAQLHSNIAKVTAGLNALAEGNHTNASATTIINNLKVTIRSIHDLIVPELLKKLGRHYQSGRYDPAKLTEEQKRAVHYVETLNKQSLELQKTLSGFVRSDEPYRLFLTDRTTDGNT